MRLRRNAAILPLLGAALLTAACGASSSPGTGTSSKPSANPDTVATIVPAMQAAVGSATSVHISGTVVDGSQNDTIDMSFVGNDASGTVSQSGQSYTILLVAGQAYVQVNQAFLNAANLPVSDCSSMCGKWVAIPQSQLAQVTGSLSMSSITKQFVTSLPSSVTRDTTDVFSQATLNGQPVLQFAQGGYTIDVAATGKPYLLYASASKQGSLTFSEWNAVPPLTAPPASDVIAT